MPLRQLGDLPQNLRRGLRNTPSKIQRTTSKTREVIVEISSESTLLISFPSIGDLTQNSLVS